LQLPRQPAPGYRIKSFTPNLAAALNRLESGSWKLRSFQVQDGYANMLLDGIWLRGPYLHNGSVPTLRDLLDRPDKRPPAFCRGSDVYDWKNVGFVSPTDLGKCEKGTFPDDTNVSGNSKEGHQFGPDLEDADKEAPLEYLKTL